jgi:hypothetical protein
MIKKKEIIIAIVFFLLGLGLMLIYNRNELVSNKITRENVSDIVVTSSQLYNLSELKYVFFAQEASKDKGFPKESIGRLDELKRQQNELLLKLNGLLNKFGFQQDLKPVPIPLVEEEK